MIDAAFVDVEENQVARLELAALAFMPLANPFLVGKRAAFRGISARKVAAAMLGATRSGRTGVQRYANPGIHALLRLTSPRTALAPDRKPARAR